MSYSTIAAELVNIGPTASFCWLSAPCLASFGRTKHAVR